MCSFPVHTNSTTTSIGIGRNHTGIVTEGGQLIMWDLNDYVPVYVPTKVTDRSSDIRSVLFRCSESFPPLHLPPDILQTIISFFIKYGDACS